jgi:hypothetical protein
MNQCAFRHSVRNLPLNDSMKALSVVRLRQIELALESNRFSLEIERLENYVEILKLRRDFSTKEGLDLSRFETVYEGGASKDITQNKPAPRDAEK